MSKVLITGANRGIGLELTRQYLAAGHQVIACCRNPNGADDLQSLAGDRLSVMQLDPADAASVEALAAAVDDLDILINNAGTSGPSRDQQSLDNMDYDGWMDAFAVNTMAPLRMLQALRPQLKASGGKAITITSQMGALDLNWPVVYAYCSSKAAVNKVMRMASAELEADGIAVGLIHPGHVQTDMGGAEAALTVEESAGGIISVIDGITLANTGCFMKWDGEPHAW